MEIWLAVAAGLLIGFVIGVWASAHDRSQDEAELRAEIRYWRSAAMGIYDWEANDELA
jgi:hypothetical protein